jgi:hypothetical protein
MSLASSHVYLPSLYALYKTCWLIQARLYLDPIQLFNFSSLTNLEEKQRKALKQVKRALWESE